MTAAASPPGFTIPDGYTFLSASRCRACEERIAWCRTKADRTAPLNADGTSHFATCPDAQQFRKAR